jgi:nucleoside-diphosphate-sugar epimerase
LRRPGESRCDDVPESWADSLTSVHVVILGVNGVTGRAIAAQLSRWGSEVVGTGRDIRRFPESLRDRGVRFLCSDRHDAADLDRVLRAGADVIVDCLCYTAEHARQLLEHRESFGSAIVLSSKAVYVDDQGRHSNSDQSPRFDGPVPETQPVLEPDFSGAYQSRQGYGPNKVAAEITLRESGAPMSVLRASRVHGPGASPPREWFVVKRLLDGRHRIPVAHQGQTGNHPTAAVNLAKLVMTCAQRPGARVLNAADPDLPTAADIVRAVAAACRRPAQVVGLDADAPPGLGWTPWATWPPFFLDTTASARLGYQPAGTYSDTVRSAVQELLERSPEQRTRLEEDPDFDRRFDYSLDDAALGYQDRAGSGRPASGEPVR